MPEAERSWLDVDDAFNKTAHTQCNRITGAYRYRYPAEECWTDGRPSVKHHPLFERVNLNDEQILKVVRLIYENETLADPSGQYPKMPWDEYLRYNSENEMEEMKEKARRILAYAEMARESE